MKQFGVSSPRELDPKLRAVGTSVEREKRAFIEFMLAQQWQGQQIKRDDEITLDQMVTYYRQHQDEFTRPARAKWEELMVRFSKYPTRRRPEKPLREWETRCSPARRLPKWPAPVPTASRPPTAAGATGPPRGVWCQELDQALFGLPIGQLSPIIKGPIGFHIIRVTEREEAAVTPFPEAQVDIREKIVKQRSAKQLHEYLAKLQARTPVKTIFDGRRIGPTGQRCAQADRGVAGSAFPLAA